MAPVDMRFLDNRSRIIFVKIKKIFRDNSCTGMQASERRETTPGIRGIAGRDPRREQLPLVTMRADRSRNWRRGVSSAKSATSKTLWPGGFVRKSTSAPNFRGCNLSFGKSHCPDKGWGVPFS